MTTAQHKLAGRERKRLRWGSHIPLNKSVMNSFPISGVLELGAGMYSTPLFFENTEDVVSIETDATWIQKLRDEKHITETQRHYVIHHNIPDYIKLGTLRKEISKEIHTDTLNFYKEANKEQLNYLFIDCYAGFRLLALENLYESFDVIAYHDAESKNDRHYDYTEFKANNQYEHFIDKTFLAHTGILISKRFSQHMQLFKSNLEIESKNYANKFNAAYEVKLVKIT